MKPSFKNTNLLYLAILLCAILISCSKNSDTKNTDTPVNPEMFYKIQRVENFYVQGDDKNPTKTRPTVFFSLEQKKEVEATHSKTTKWDLSFGGLFNSFVGGNNGKTESNHGYPSAAIGGIMIVEKPFEEVIDVPEDNLFKAKSDLIGTDQAGDFGDGIGWYIYDYSGNHVRNNDYNNQHIAYALSKALKLTNGKVIHARTIIAKTAHGNYAKIKMISCYKNLWKPEKWFRTSPKMYFTFEYVLVPKGSKKFEIK